MVTVRDPHDPIYKLIGEATVAWNGIDHGWMLVFQALLGAPQRHAKAIYRAIRTNSAQRDMITALARAAYRDNGTMCDKIVQLANETGHEGGSRNALSHGFYGIDVFEVEGSHEWEISSLKIIDYPKGSLTDKDLEVELPPIIARFNNLASRIFALLQDIGEHPPSPDKPPQQ